MQTTFAVLKIARGYSSTLRVLHIWYDVSVGDYHIDLKLYLPEV